jgi:hypothetical protein
MGPGGPGGQGSDGITEFGNALRSKMIESGSQEAF